MTDDLTHKIKKSSLHELSGRSAAASAAVFLCAKALAHLANAMSMLRRTMDDERKKQDMVKTGHRKKEVFYGNLFLFRSNFYRSDRGNRLYHY